MAKDDYDVIVFKILTYLYAVLKRKILFDKNTFHHAIGYKSINDDYFMDILYMIDQDGYIEGAVFAKAWGNFHILANDLSDIKITSKGIQYLTENNKMNKIKDFLLENVDTIASLIKMIF